MRPQVESITKAQVSVARPGAPFDLGCQLLGLLCGTASPGTALSTPSVVRSSSSWCRLISCFTNEGSSESVTVVPLIRQAGTRTQNPGPGVHTHSLLSALFHCCV